MEDSIKAAILFWRWQNLYGCERASRHYNTPRILARQGGPADSASA